MNYHNDDNVDSMQKINFDFEAFSPDSSDLEGILDLITQIFLRANVDCEGIAKKVIETSPLGCIFKPSEECEDEDIGSLVYGVVSAIDLLSNEKCLSDLREFIIQRAKKHAKKEVTKQLEELFVPNSNKRVGLLINERMIHFPAAIAEPSFKSLKEDLANLSKNERFDYILMFLKIRASDESKSISSVNTSTVGGSQPNNKQKKGKAEKKRLAAEKLETADLIFDNAEENLLFEENIFSTYFQYPVQSDVEKGSKFHATICNGIIYRPYRRVCLLTIDQFNTFVDNISNMFSS